MLRVNSPDINLIRVKFDAVHDGFGKRIVVASKTFVPFVIRIATNYLLDLGHTRIGYPGSLSVRIYSADRKSGYILALTEAGIPYDPAMCIELPSIPKEGADDLTEFLSSENRPTALVVSDDIIAMVIEKTAYELGLRIPEDLSIVSFNNSLLATKIIVPYYLVERQSCCPPKQ